VSFLVLLVVVGLVVLSVWWLQRNQANRRRDSVDRSRELPPLTTAILPDFVQSPLLAAVIAPQAAEPSQPPVPAASAIAMPPAASAPTATPIEPSNATTQSWQDQVKVLKDKGQLEMALVACQQQFPKAQAFQQAAIVLRLQLKQLLEQDQDLTPLLTKLYRCAILADLFRSGIAHKPINPRQAMKGLASHEFPYSQIGHSELKLLSKSDVKLLEQRWGQPAQHIHAEASLGTLWENICR
jgi:hypothetical protein